MQEEIKEILDGLEKISTPIGISYSGDVTINNNDVKILRDYITNLQEEDYKSRNEKAIEYIELGLANEEEAEELLDILNGVDKE